MKVKIKQHEEGKVFENILNDFDYTQKETMKECTLKEALQMRAENGGVIYKKEDPSVKYALEGSDTCKLYTCDDVTAVWIYEPPKESAFEKLRKNYSFLNPDISVYDIARDFYDSALDAVLDLQYQRIQSASYDEMFIKVSDIEKLREG
jgi:hypothetical protein